jgi:ABC-type Fe3+ transport system permease subunit
VSWLLVVIWPVASLVMGAYRGRGLIRIRSALWQEIGDSLVLGVTVTLGLGLVLWVGSKLYDGRPRLSVLRRTRMSVIRWAAMLLLLPGLLGSLALGLTIFEICQRLGVQPSYSPVPLVLGIMLFLLPRALALQAMLRRNEQQAGVFLAESLTQLPGPRGRQGAAILWHIRDAGRFWTLALLFWWSYLELTLPALLRPAGMAPAPLRLYNFLHYGHIPGLAAMLAVVLLVPVLLLTVGKGIWMRMDSLSTEER